MGERETDTENRLTVARGEESGERGEGKKKYRLAVTG